MKKILIDNCVPLNNGDAALIMGLYKQLKKRKYKIVFSCIDNEEARSKYPDFTWYKSHINTFFYKLCFKSRILIPFWKLVNFIQIVVLKNEYKHNDVVISAPGGYIHSYYGIEGRMYILYLCKKYLHKKVGIYSQSIGALNKKDRKIFFKYGKTLDFIFARDFVSFERAKFYGLNNNLTLTKDAAFLLYENSSINYYTKGKQVAISLRSWQYGDSSMEKYYKMIQEAVQFLLENDYQITFLSTCQGIENYVDDSSIAKEFIKKYGYTNNGHIKIDDSYYNLTELQKEIRKYDFVIGTRLHMCLLSWINKVPAFNISYEEKGKESFKYLGISQYCVDFNSGSMVDNLDSFLKMSETIKFATNERVKNIAREQKIIFDKLMEIV